MTLSLWAEDDLLRDSVRVCVHVCVRGKERRERRNNSSMSSYLPQSRMITYARAFSSVLNSSTKPFFAVGSTFSVRRVYTIICFMTANSPGIVIPYQEPQLTVRKTDEVGEMVRLVSGIIQASLCPPSTPRLYWS